MGYDISVSFTGEAIDLDRFARSVSGSGAGIVYLVLGKPSRHSGQKHYFSLWADSDIDLRWLCCEISRSAGLVLTAWKSEHGGVSGFLLHDSGQEVASDQDQSDEYLLTPLRAFSQAFGIAPDLPRHGEYAFPEIVFGSESRCYRFVNSERGFVAVESEPDTLEALIEDELEVEPVLPVSS